MKLRNLLLSICFLLFCTSNVFGVAADMYTTSGGAGTKSGADWDNAFSVAEFETDVEGSAEAGDRYFVKGTQTFTQSIISALDGNLINMIEVIGVKSGTTATPPLFADYAFDADRPVFAQGAFVFQVDFSWRIQNIIVTSTAADSTSTDDDSAYINIKCTNTSGTSGRLCVAAGDDSFLLDNEFISTNGYGSRNSGSNIRYYGNYFHDSDIGLRTEGAITIIAFNIFDTCATQAISINALDRNFIINNTLYGANTGIAINTAANDSDRNLILNNIIQDFDSGLDFNSVQGSNYADYNSYFSNTNDRVNFTKENNVFEEDATFGDAAGGDFSIGTNLKAASFPGEFPGALSTGYLDVGAVQRVEAAASGTNATGAISVGF